MLSITNLTYRVGGRTLIEDAGVQISAGQRVGLVGRNGAGKSTLLALIRGELHPDAGSGRLWKRARIGWVAQEAPGGAVTPLAHVLAADAERAALLEQAERAHDSEHGHGAEHVAEIHQRLDEIGAAAAPARAASILAGLGFDEALQARSLGALSGGWRMRAALAAVLFAEPDLLLLDEPTNHLDLEATVWLTEYLMAYPRTIVLVSHDRHILNAVPTHILHIDRAKLTLYTGNYDAFERLRRERQMAGAATAKAIEQRRAHMQEFVDRFRAKATKARQAQSRLKALAKLPPPAVEEREAEVTLAFPAPSSLKPPLVSFDKAAVGYAPGQPILRGIDLRLDPEDRIALLGANGNGKSTLAKLIAGRLKPMSGHETRSNKLACGFFAQHQIEDMEPERTPFQALGHLMRLVRPEQVRARLGRFGFSQEKANVRIRDLSGGEKARLNFALITQNAPQLLVLDEPTNHLDLASREALIEAINEFPGAVVLISHDWHLLELTCDRLWLVAEGRVRPFEGDLEEYRRLTLAQTRRQPKERGPKPGQAQRDTGVQRDTGALGRQARAAETALTKLNADKAGIDAELADPAIYRDAVRLRDLARRRDDIAREIASAEERWLAATSALEEAGAGAS